MTKAEFRKFNMTKYFYDCPIKAAYMAKEFGVKLTLDGKLILADWVVPLNIANTYHDGKVNFYVTKESEHIFKSKIGDLVIFDPKETEPVYKNDKGEILYYKSRISPHDNIMVLNQHFMEPYLLESVLEILKRDDKVFFMPEKLKEELI